MSGYKMDCSPGYIPYLLTSEERRRARRLVREGTCGTIGEAAELIQRLRKKIGLGGAPPGPGKGPG